MRYTKGKMFNWTKENEAEVLKLKNIEKWTYVKIAQYMGTTQNSVKHKIRRLQQADGLEKYSHPKEKTELVSNAVHLR